MPVPSIAAHKVALAIGATPRVGFRMEIAAFNSFNGVDVLLKEFTVVLRRHGNPFARCKIKCLDAHRLARILDPAPRRNSA